MQIAPGEAEDGRVWPTVGAGPRLEEPLGAVGLRLLVCTPMSSFFYRDSEIQRFRDSGIQKFRTRQLWVGTYVT